MHQRKAIIILAMMHSISLMAVAQTQDSAAAIINYKIQNNRADFSSSLRPLHQKAGAPEAFYSYFWEFGDGSFSFQENPKHIYKDTGSYNVRLYATNNYDDGKPPPLRPKPVKVNSMSNYASGNNSIFRKEGAIEMRVNRMPRADEDMILIMGYRNENNTPLNGSVVLFYNEKQFRNTNFDLTEDRTYFTEKRSSLNSITAISDLNKDESSSQLTFSGPNANNNSERKVDRNFSGLIASKQKIFRSNNTWHFSDLTQGEEKYFFLNLHTAPEMIRDTNAVVTLTGMLVPDDPNGDIEEFSLEIQIVASHDPNRMMLKNSRLNYRFTGTKKEMEYRVRFQNSGRGPSKQINIGVNVPPMMDPHSLEIMDFYPKCQMCDLVRAGQSCMDTIIGKDSIYFVFKNIYLPGLRETGMNDPDSTVGFIKYRLHFNKELKKLPFESGAMIMFDKNKPISTNGSRGYFKPGNSPALMVGYNKFLATAGKNNVNPNSWMAGAAISSYSPYKKYLQAELLVGSSSVPEQFIGHIQNKDTVIDNAPWRLISRDTYVKQKQINLNIVPIQLRYNFMDFIGAGVGTQLFFNARTENITRTEMQLLKLNGGNTVMTTSSEKQTKWFKSFDMAVFADLQVGLVRVGPVGGMRYLHYFKVPQNVLFFYAAWRL